MPAFYAAALAVIFICTNTMGQVFQRCIRIPLRTEPEVSRVYWLPSTSHDGYFSVWKSTSSYNSTFYIYKRNAPSGIVNLSTPDEFLLNQNFPNPFNPTSNITYSLPKNAFVEIKIYDIKGDLVTTLVNGTEQAGLHKIEFDGTNYSSGVYFYRLVSAGITETRKMLLVK